MKLKMQNCWHDLQNFQVQFEKDLLVNTVKTGARLSGDYVLNYTKDVTDAIKRMTKEQLPSLSNELTSIN